MVLVLILFLVRDGIGEDAVGDVDQAPFVFAGQRVDVTMAQKSTVVIVLQFLDTGRPTRVLIRAQKQPNGALVLLAALHQHLLFLALRLKCETRNLHIEIDGDNGGHQEHEEQCESPFLRTTAAARMPNRPLAHALHSPAPASSASGMVCSCLYCRSNTTAELTPMRTRR